ncbi:hypothetical protein [Kitasatospora sp. NPDC094016]|uniref:hypothetical protein n=1 Tax=Kitasatospora sp. NPDC094016 TaxID=3154986 RepID=UPI00332C4449
MTESSLTYTVQPDPDPLQISGDSATVTITVANNSQQTVPCGSFTFTLPIGSGAEDLTENPDGIGEIKPSNWTFSQQPASSGVFVAKPSSPKAKMIHPGDILTFTLNSIVVNATVGTCELTIAEGTDPAPPDQRIPLDKVPAGVEFTDFAPKRETVARGSAASLIWKATNPPPQGVSYTLQYGAAEQVVVDNLEAWDSPPLYQDTEFILRLNATRDGQQVEHSLIALVTVTEPDLYANDLSVSGTAQGLSAPQTLLTGTEKPPESYLAETDGLVSGWIHTTDGDVPATLSVKVTPPQGPAFTTSVESYSDPDTEYQTRECLYVPVPKGSKVEIRSRSDTGELNALVQWSSWGAGRLVAQP